MLSTVVCGNYFAEPDTILVFKIFYGVFRDGTRLAMRKTIYAPDSSSLKPGSGATERVLDQGVLGRLAYYSLAGLMGCEGMKTEDYTHVRIGLSLAWKASLATNYEDSILCNRLYVTLDPPPGVYINRRV